MSNTNNGDVPGTLASDLRTLAGFPYLGEHPRTTYNWGDVQDVGILERLLDLYPDVPDEEEARYLIEELGTESYDDTKTEAFEMLLRQLVTENGVSGGTRIPRLFTPPKEWYHDGFSTIAYFGVLETVPDRLTVYRIDGIWTDDGFHTISRSEVLSVDVPD